MKVKIPNWIKIFWIIILPGLLVFNVRMTYEYIYLTYKNGPQMYGFSLIHLHPMLYIFMILSYSASIIWTLVYTVWIIKVKIEKKKPDGLWIFATTLFLVVFILLLDPISKSFY